MFTEIRERIDTSISGKLSQKNLIAKAEQQKSDSEEIPIVHI